FTLRAPSTLPLFPYTTLFRSAGVIINSGCAVYRTDIAVDRAVVVYGCGVAHSQAEADRLPRHAGNRAGVSNPDCASPSHLREDRSEEHTSELQSLTNLVCRLL